MTKQLICEITKFCLLLRGYRIKQLGISVHCEVNKRHATILCRPIFLFPLFQIYHSFHWLHSGRQKGIISGGGSYVTVIQCPLDIIATLDIAAALATATSTPMEFGALALHK